MAIELPAGLLTAEKWDGFVEATRAALVHMVEQGEVPEFVGEPMTGDQALEYLEGWLDRNKSTLVEGSVDFLGALGRRLAVGDGPDEPIEEFESKLVSMTDEQLVELNKAEANEIEALKKDVVDRRRQLVADLLETGKQLLRGAVSSGLHAAMGAV